MTDKMPNLEPSVDNPETKKKRRTKGEEADRKHVCKICNKTYLSYPALYTHTKTKHQRPANSTAKQEPMKKTIPQDPHEFIDALVAQLGPWSSVEGQQYSLQKVLEPFQQQKHQLQDALLYWKSNPTEKMNEDTKCMRTTIDQMFVKVLHYLLNKVSLSALRQLAVTLIIWRKCINENWKEYQAAGVYNCYSKEADCQNVLKGVNDLILRYFPQHSQQYLAKIKQPKLLCGEAIEANLCDLLMTLSRLFHAENYTHDRLKFNEYL